MKRSPRRLPAISICRRKAKVGYSSMHVDGPYIAMTFDDGPSPTLTPKLLDLLKAKGIKVTFFVVARTLPIIPRSCNVRLPRVQ